MKKVVMSLIALMGILVLGLARAEIRFEGISGLALLGAVIGFALIFFWAYLEDKKNR